MQMSAFYKYLTTYFVQNSYFLNVHTTILKSITLTISSVVF